MRCSETSDLGDYPRRGCFALLRREFAAGETGLKFDERGFWNPACSVNQHRTQPPGCEHLAADSQLKAQPRTTCMRLKNSERDWR